MRRVLTTAIFCLAAVVSVPLPADALEVRVAQIRVAGARLAASFELRELLRDNFLKLVQGGRAVFVQLQADVWEDRRVFDRVVIAGVPVTFRIDRDAASPGVVIADQYGTTTAHPDVRAPLPLHVDLGPANRIDDDTRYYIHALVTAATVDEQDIERAGEAIFGDDQSARGLASLGRFVFRTLLRMGKYFESAEAEVTSRRVTGREIKAGAF